MGTKKMSMGRCPKCGSYDVRTVYQKNTGGVLKKIAEFTVAIGVGLLIGGGHGLHAAHNIAESFDSKEKELVKHHCNTCDHEW